MMTKAKREGNDVHALYKSLFIVDTEQSFNRSINIRYYISQQVNKEKMIQSSLFAFYDRIR